MHFHPRELRHRSRPKTPQEQFQGTWTLPEAEESRQWLILWREWGEALRIAFTGPSMPPKASPMGT